MVPPTMALSEVLLGGECGVKFRDLSGGTFIQPKPFTEVDFGPLWDRSYGPPHNGSLGGVVHNSTGPGPRRVSTGAG